jgi:3-methyl-2-oxobutanoate hydroxymethyltransferase
MKKTINELREIKSFGKIAMLTAYDFPSAQLADENGIDVVLVGDSVGTNVLGYKDVSEVTMEDMLHHVKAVARGAKNAFILADFPYKSFQTPEQGVENAKCLMNANADGVKIEGGTEIAGIVDKIVQNNIPVCAHIGYTPQTKGEKPTVQGRDALSAKELITSAIDLEKAGAFMIVLELLTLELAGEITKILRIPTIGIGSGPLCDGQVLVIHDMTGLTARKFKHVKNYGNARKELAGSIALYSHEVKNSLFPAVENSSSMESGVHAQVGKWITESNIDNKNTHPGMVCRD